MKNIEFLASLPKQTFAVSGSFGIKLHYPSFRDYKDIDISFLDSFTEFLIFCISKDPETKTEIDGQYWVDRIHAIFSDGSELDMISCPDLWKIEVAKGWFNVFPLSVILKYKADLLNQYEVGSEKYMKHAMDLAFFIKEWKIII